MAAICAADGAILASNHAWQDVFGPHSHHWTSRLDPQDPAALAAARMLHLPSNGLDCRLCDQTGSWLWVNLRSRALPDPHQNGTSNGQSLISAFPIEPYLRRAAMLQVNHDLMIKMLDASEDCIKILSPSGQLRRMNRAGCHALGVPEGSDFGMPWLGLLPEEIRLPGQEAITSAQNGATGRFPGRSELPGKPAQFWDNMLTPLLDADGTISDIICISRDVTVEHQQQAELLAAKAALQASADELSTALAAKELLAGEMLHRIRNLFSVISVLITMSKREVAHDAATLQALDNLKQRIIAMARATELLMQQSAAGHSTTEIDPFGISAATLDAFSDHVTLQGEAAPLPRNQLTPLVLMLHELATNSLKYGALSAPAGKVQLDWSTDPRGGQQMLWSEHNGPIIAASPDTEGQGSGMLRNLASMAGWTLEQIWHPQGLVARVTLPASSVTPAPAA